MSSIGTHLVPVLVLVRAWVWVQGGGKERRLIESTLRGLEQGREDVMRVPDLGQVLLGLAPQVGQDPGGVQIGEVVVVTMAMVMAEMAPTQTNRAALPIMVIPRLALDGPRLGGGIRPGGDYIVVSCLGLLEESSNYVHCSFSPFSSLFFFSPVLHCPSVFSFCSIFLHLTLFIQ